MMLEWLRRHDPAFDRHLRTYLFTTGSIVEIEAGAEGAAPQGKAAVPAGDGSFGIGSLRGETS
jgi:hypothetical protein